VQKAVGFYGCCIFVCLHWRCRGRVRRILLQVQFRPGVGVRISCGAVRGCGRVFRESCDEVRFLACFELSALVFWRASSYLPYWQSSQGQWYLEELVPRNGDGPGPRPDKLCKFSRVRIIESSPARAIVHWRYVPDFGNTNWDGFVDEYFTVYPDGVCIRTIRRGQAKLDAWVDAANVTIQKLRLAGGGIDGKLGTATCFFVDARVSCG